MDDNIGSTNKSIIDDIDGYSLSRCIKCYKIIVFSPTKLDDNENLIPQDHDGKHHKCFGYDIMEKSDSLTPNRLTEELFLNIIRHTHLDEKTGRVKRTYESHVRTLYYAQTPVFILHLSHIQDNKIKQELAELIDDPETLDEVMREVIRKVFECITSERQYNLSIRNRLRWKIVE
jgi:CRISPR/Cas system-associated endoribonuclease Cas2